MYNSSSSSTLHRMRRGSTADRDHTHIPGIPFMLFSLMRGCDGMACTRCMPVQPRGLSSGVSPQALSGSLTCPLPPSITVRFCSVHSWKAVCCTLSSSQMCSEVCRSSSWFPTATLVSQQQQHAVAGPHQHQSAGIVVLRGSNGARSQAAGELSWVQLLLVVGRLCAALLAVRLVAVDSWQ